jgi:hypothetical protein
VNLKGYNNILTKLSDFTKKYYTKLLLKGLLFFLAFGLLFFLVTLGVEYFLWLNSTGRLILLLIFISIELFLLYKYILIPLFYLFKLKKGITIKQASLLIGKHFPEIDDKLYNLLDLAEDKNKSELLLASIEQRSENLDAVPFTNAVDFKENLKYVKYLAIPALLFGLIWVSGNFSDFFGSYNRVVNYDIAYEPPAPFSFKLLSNNLEVLDSKTVMVQVITEGKVRPEQVYISINGKDFLLQQQNGIYQYTFVPPLKTTNFSFKANDLVSRIYQLTALKTPSIQNFELVLNYPNYTNRTSEKLKGTGNATFPEGTKVTWLLNGKNTDEIRLVTNDKSQTFTKSSNQFQFTKRVLADLKYELRTSNQNISDYENLGYQLKVIKDAYPTIKVKQVLDSLNLNTSYYVGEVSDDYKLRSIRLVCYPEDDNDKKQLLDIGSPESNFDQFYYTFPSGLVLDEGRNYSFYFEVTDNDGVRNGKSSKSKVFSTSVLDKNELRNTELESQQSIINNLDKSLEKFKEQKETLKEINKGQKEKKELNFNDQNQIKDFLKKQQQQEQMMQKFSKQLKDNLNKNEKEDEMNDLLKERLERQEIEAKKNQKLLEELNRIADKIDKEELTKRLEELGKKQQNSERNLEQLLELTKRYYVTEKAAQLAKDLEALAIKQEKEADKEDSDGKKEEQDTLNEEFSKLTEELEELSKDNNDLKKPIDLGVDRKKEEGVKEDQQKALEELSKQKYEPEGSKEKKDSGKNASKKQKAAAQKMKEMSEQLEQSSSGGGGGSSIAEDAEMLRQILDNLIIFSFKQENLYEELETIDSDAPQFSGSIREQQELRKLFEHVDDSLFALSLRQAELSEFVNEQITEVYYNTDKALEAIAESQIYQGESYQKYVLSAANGLSDFLANMLDNMQQSMQSGEGEGEGQGFQLPDIIKQQEELKEKMKGQGKSGEGNPKPGEGKGKKGEGKEGKDGKGKSGENGKDGEGKQGSSDNGGEGKSGKDGKGGEGDGNGEGEGKGGDMGNGKMGKSSDFKEDGKGGTNEGDQPTESELKEIYEVFKEQQAIRARLEEQLSDMINSGDRKLGEKLIKQMEDFENDLLENGFTQRGMNKMNNIQYEMLKLENAAMKKGKKSERESNSNNEEFNNPIITKPSILDNYRNEIEILNRQALPLRQNHQFKVKEYFKNND